jgi:hypothetical protein
MKRLLILLLATCFALGAAHLLFASQGMMPGPGVKAYSGGASIAVGVHGKGTGASGSATTNSVTSAASGSTFVVFCQFTPGQTFTSITDSKSNSYTQIGTEEANGGLVGRLYYTANGTGGSGHTASCATSASDLAVYLLEITGAQAASLDSGSVNDIFDNTSPFTVTSGTLAQAAELVVAAIGTDSGSNPATLAESSGFTIQEKLEDGTTVWPGGIATKIVSATTALTPSFTQTGATGAILWVAGFKQ